MGTRYAFAFELIFHGGWSSLNIRWFVVCVAVVAAALGASAGEDTEAAWDDPESDADGMRWEQAWLDEHRRRANAVGLDSAAQRAERLGDTSTTDMLRFPGGSALPSLGAGMPVCDERRQPVSARGNRMCKSASPRSSIRTSRSKCRRTDQ